MYKVKLTVRFSNPITTIVPNEIELSKLLQLLIDNKNYKLAELTFTTNYESYVDVIEILQKEAKPKSLTYGKLEHNIINKKEE